jgi:hypothetical protein
MTLIVVTVVLLGGVNIFGGSGSIPGVVGRAAVAVMQNALRLAGVSIDVQAPLSATSHRVCHPHLRSPGWSALDRVRRGRSPPADSVGMSEEPHV